MASMGTPLSTGRFAFFLFVCESGGMRGCPRALRGEGSTIYSGSPPWRRRHDTEIQSSATIHPNVGRTHEPAHRACGRGRCQDPHALPTRDPISWFKELFGKTWNREEAPYSPGSTLWLSFRRPSDTAGPSATWQTSRTAIAARSPRSPSSWNPYCSTAAPTAHATVAT